MLRENKQLKRQIEEVQSEKETYQDSLKKHLIDEGLTKSLLENGVKNPVFLEASRDMLRKKVKLVQVGDEYEAVFGEEEKELDRAVKEWAMSEKGKHFVSASENSGGGGNGNRSGNGSGGGQNPFTKEFWNRTQQTALYKEDPEKAKRLANQAGVKVKGINA